VRQGSRCSTRSSRISRRRKRGQHFKSRLSSAGIWTMARRSTDEHTGTLIEGVCLLVGITAIPAVRWHRVRDSSVMSHLRVIEGGLDRHPAVTGKIGLLVPCVISPTIGPSTDDLPERVRRAKPAWLFNWSLPAWRSSASPAPSGCLRPSMWPSISAAQVVRRRFAEGTPSAKVTGLPNIHLPHSQTLVGDVGGEKVGHGVSGPARGDDMVPPRRRIHRVVTDPIDLDKRHHDRGTCSEDFVHGRGDLVSATCLIRQGP
jgi:hypothetical protein